MDNPNGTRLGHYEYVKTNVPGVFERKYVKHPCEGCGMKIVDGELGCHGCTKAVEYRRYCCEEGIGLLDIDAIRNISER